MNSPLVEWTESGLYCRAGDFYIDPNRRVKSAVITHAHSDHARRGSAQYICEQTSVGLLKVRLGPKIDVTGIPYREPFRLKDTLVSFHSAGHILGSAQIRIQHGPEVWVVSGDYKRDPDPSCEPFESVPCHTFITEATFGTPKYVWDKTRDHGREIFEWWEENAELGQNSLLYGYSLGKSQRILAALEPFARRPVLIHSSMVELTDCYRREGRKLAPTRCLDEKGVYEPLDGELILAPPSILKTEWITRLGRHQDAFASGWMQGSTFFRADAYDHGFVISDHADWDDLNRTIDESGAKQIFVLHRSGSLIAHLRRRGIQAHPAEALRPERFERLGGMNLDLF